MRIGTRVLTPEEVGQYPVDLHQIAVYSGTLEGIAIVEKCARRCREAKIPFVIHPVGYSLLDRDRMKSLKAAAGLAPEAIILHDESSPGGGRLAGSFDERFRAALGELKTAVPVSLENAENTLDIRWFWDTYADSVTVDIGHVEGAGLDSFEFVSTLDRNTIAKIRYVHLHRYNGWHDGLNDHWPLTPGCREIKAFEKLLDMHADPAAILEISGTEGIGESIELLKNVRDNRRKST